MKVFRGTDKAMVVIDHNAKGTDQIAGGDDKRAAVWGVFNMRKLYGYERGDMGGTAGGA